MFWWLIGSLFNSLSSIWYKKALVEAKNQGVTSLLTALAMNLNALSMLVLAAFVPAFQRVANVWYGDTFRIHPELFAIFAGIALLGLVSWLLGQYAYANEKISVLAPFAETRQFLTIVLGFAFFNSNTSPFTFVMAVIAGLIIIGSSLDPKTLAINRYCWSLILGGLLRAFSAIGIAYALTHVSPVTFVMTDLTIASILLAVSFAYAYVSSRNRHDPTVKAYPFPDKPLPILRELSINNAFWLVSYVIGLTLVQNLGLVASTLIAMTWMVTTIAISAIILHDMPTKKSLFTAFAVTICIGLGSFYGK